MHFYTSTSADQCEMYRSPWCFIILKLLKAMKTISPVRIAKIEDTGRKIILDDNSKWEVYFDDLPTSSRWSPTNWVIVWQRDQLAPW